MARSKKQLTFVEAMLKMKEAGIDKSPSPNRACSSEWQGFPSLEQRLALLFDLIANDKRPANRMLFFIMYDIESNRVRTKVVKYLQRKGCHRVQKSIFLADLPTATFEEIKRDLVEVQACYDNQDSILIVPISTDYLKAMKVIGEEICIDVITRSRNTLFF